MSYNLYSDFLQKGSFYDIMGLPPTSYARSLKHTRHIDVTCYRRDDGLWELDAHFVDVKPIDINLNTFFLPANIPVHNLWLRLVIDHSFTIVESNAYFDNVPLAGFCDSIQKVYKNLAGLNVRDHFREQIKERFGTVNGCVHLNELLDLVPTIAVEALNPVGDTEEPTLCQQCSVKKD